MKCTLSPEAGVICFLTWGPDRLEKAGLPWKTSCRPHSWLMFLPAHSFIRDDAERHSPVLPHCVWVLAAPVRGHNNSQRVRWAHPPAVQCCTEARSGPLEGAAEHTHTVICQVDGSNLWIHLLNCDFNVLVLYSSTLQRQISYFLLH